MWKNILAMVVIEPNVVGNNRKEEIITFMSDGGCFFNWQYVYPQLSLLQNNIDVLKEEAKNIHQVVKCRIFLENSSILVMVSLSGFLGRRIILLFEATAITAIGLFSHYYILFLPMKCMFISNIVNMIFILIYFFE